MALNIQGYETIDRYPHPRFAQQLATHSESGETVLITQIPVPAHIQNHDLFVSAMRRLKTIRLNGVSRVKDAGVSGDTYYIVAEFTGSPSLQARMDAGIDQHMALKVVYDLAKTLDELALAGHPAPRFTPADILTTEDGQTLLCNLYIDQLFQQLGHSDGADLRYISPEFIKAEAESTASSYYSLGVILYQMLTGSLPFDAEDPLALKQQHLKSAPPALNNAATPYPELLSGLLKKSAARRWQKADRLLTNPASSPSSAPVMTASRNDDAVTDLELVTEQREPSAAPDTSTDNSSGTKRSNAGLLTATAAALALSAGAAIWFAPQVMPGNALLMDLHKNMQAMLGIQKAAPIATPAPEPQADPRLVRIQNLLNDAEDHMAIQAYLAPQDANAFASYQAVLVIEKTNARALKGIDNISSKLTFLALSAIENDDLKAAESYIGNLDSMGEYAKSTANLKELLAERLALIDQQAQQAQQAAAAKKAAQQAAEAAQRKAEADRLAAEQKRADDARRKAIEEKRIQAERQAREDALLEEQRQTEARAAAAAEKAKADALFRKVKTNGLLAKADTYFQRGDYYSPAQNNALEKYQEALALDAENARAKAGIELVVAKMIPDIQANLDSQHLSMARNLHAQASQASPQNTQLFDIAMQQGWHADSDEASVSTTPATAQPLPESEVIAPDSTVDSTIAVPAAPTAAVPAPDAAAADEMPSLEDTF
ncbi:Serine/threonine-protein kinase PknB [BD1-7 clade bacterium]|uniref:Serine/threonine-protein kinase PknB n=1 Tax=BD1-7 clade bacterium TaxID=2029982 RepID=A0A5S9MUL3_9GAMM|nr:Serine/threonine-protein kinase PknB [BD1-7 clade bacterium]